VGNLKGVGRIPADLNRHQHTFIDTYAKLAWAKLYDRKTPISAADLLNERVIPFFDSHDAKLLRVLTDRAASITAIQSGTSTSSISRSKTSIPRAPKPGPDVWLMNTMKRDHIKAAGVSAKRRC
jgi:hypothetical protein